MAQEAMNDRPVGELVRELSEQTATLVRKELQLAQLEMTEKGKRAGIGAGLFGGAGVVALFGGGALVAAIVLLLATSLEPWLSALIVAVVLFAVAGVAALVGKKQVEQAVPPAARAGDPEHQARCGEVKGRAGR